MRLLRAIACELDLDLCNFDDVDQAFVRSKLEEDMFTRLSKGCSIHPVKLCG